MGNKRRNLGDTQPMQPVNPQRAERAGTGIQKSSIKNTRTAEPLRTEITQQAAGKQLKCNHTADEKKEEKRRNEVL